MRFLVDRHARVESVKMSNTDAPVVFVCLDENGERDRSGRVGPFVNKLEMQIFYKTRGQRISREYLKEIGI